MTSCWCWTVATTSAAFASTSAWPIVERIWPPSADCSSANICSITMFAFMRSATFRCCSASRSSESPDTPARSSDLSAALAAAAAAEASESEAALWLLSSKSETETATSSVHDDDDRSLLPPSLPLPSDPNPESSETAASLE